MYSEILGLAITDCVTITTTATDCPNLRVCANLLNDLANVEVGSPQSEPCCSLIDGLADVDAVVCLCAVVVGFVFPTCCILVFQILF